MQPQQRINFYYFQRIENTELNYKGEIEGKLLQQSKIIKEDPKILDIIKSTIYWYRGSNHQEMNRKNFPWPVAHKYFNCTQYNKMNQEQHPVLKKHQFQIRKVPLRRFIPEKTPQLYAMDAHSICLPSKLKKKQQWGSLYSEANYCNYQQEFNQQILSSQAYKQLYSRYIKVRDERAKQKSELQKEIDTIQAIFQQEKHKHDKLVFIRDQLYKDIQKLRNELNDYKQKNYNLRWQVYNQRGPRYANLYGYSFLQPNQLTYEELLQMQEQIGYVSRGLKPEDIDKLSKQMYKCGTGFERQICCICYDEIQQEEWVTVLKCQHTHHCDCIKDWLLKQKICPICKQQVVIEKQMEIQEKSEERQSNKAKEGQENNPENESVLI